MKTNPCRIAISLLAVIFPAGSSPAQPPVPADLPAKVFVVPNFHPASCGWMANWSVERNYCANSYLNHLDRVRDDASYHFVMSECNNMIAIANFRPERFNELKERVKQGRVELVNGFFLESTVNLSGGEALAKMGIEGLRWQQQVMGARPRFCWAIDLCGTHAQMPQLCALLGLDALVYTRCNRAGKTIFWSESPDGSRVLTLVPWGYSDDVGGAYAATSPLTAAGFASVEKSIAKRQAHTPAGAPVLMLGGQGDYSLAPARRENPGEFIQQWKERHPACDMIYGTLSNFVDCLMPDVTSGKVKLPTVSTGTDYDFDSFWIENPRVKTLYRRNEHQLQAAEMLAAAASLKAGYDYPVQPLYHAWLQMLLNMDRNSLWGSAGGMVFESASSWDVSDRFNWVANQTSTTLEAAARRLAGEGPELMLFNPANWQRTDPLRLKLPANTSLAGATCEALSDGTTLCQVDVPATGVIGVGTLATPPAAAKAISLPAAIETPFYTAHIDPLTGALVSLKCKPSGREMLGGAANVIVAEKYSGHDEPGDYVDARPKRKRLAASGDFKSTVTVSDGPLAITVEAMGGFYGGGASKRVTRFFKNNPRVEFETDLHDIPDFTVVVAEFPLASAPTEIRRGIPFGFSRDDGTITGIVPAVRWSDYSSPGHGGVALLDRGLTGREINDRTPVIYLLHAIDNYYGYQNNWLSGKGAHHFEYALVAHDGDWMMSQVPRQAWEFNCPVTLVPNCKAVAPQSFVQTSDNVVVEAMRRDGADLEMRLVEATGEAGAARVTLNLPHVSAALTDLTGAHARPLAGGPAYEFPVRAQQIVTLRFRTAQAVPEIKPLLAWDDLVPPQKRPALRAYLPDKVGHPPPGY